MRHANKHSTQTIIRQQQIFMKRFICISVGVFALSDIKNTVCITCFIQCYHKQIILDLDKLCACVCVNSLSNLIMGNQTQIQPLSSNSIYDDHLNYPGDHTFDPLFESDPDLNALLTENGLWTMSVSIAQ